MDAVTSEMRDFTPSGGGKAGSGRGTTGDAGGVGGGVVSGRKPRREGIAGQPQSKNKVPPGRSYSVPGTKANEAKPKKSKRYPLPPVTG